MGELTDSWATSSASRRTMQANRRAHTGPELAVRKILHSAGLRYRVDFPPLPGKRWRPDIVFQRARLAVFIDGCFWHRCPQHGTQPKSNRTYWSAKLARNVERDRQADADFQNAGWRVLRIWEHEASDVAARTVMAALGRLE